MQKENDRLGEFMLTGGKVDVRLVRLLFDETGLIEIKGLAETRWDIHLRHTV